MTAISGGTVKRHAPPFPPEDRRIRPASCTSFDSSWRDLAVPRSPKQAIFWPIWRSWYTQRPSAAQPPRPDFLKGAPAGHGWRPPRAGRPPLSRRPPLGCPSRAAGASREGISTCAAPFSIGAGGRIASQSHSIERIVFYEASAAIFVKTKIKGTRSTKKYGTKGGGGIAKISLWQEIISMIEDKGLAVRAPFFPPAPFEFLSRF
jgi:hypothetical protein